MRKLVAAFAIAMGLSAGSALAQAPTEAPAATEVPAGRDEVVVTAIRPNQVRELVRQMAEPGKENQLSRWDGTVCPGVVGVQSRAAQALIDQIALRAFSVGLNVGRPGCKANVLIVVTPDAQSFTPAFVDQNKRLFSYYEDAGNALGADALRAFAETPRPVRWWHVSQTVTDRGQVLGQSDARSGDGQFAGAQVARVNSASRVRASTRQEFNRVIIIVDSTATAGRPFPAIADYVAMVALAQVRADVSHAGQDSVLALFEPTAGEAAPTAWTDWDRAYVEGLYKAPDFAANAHMQQSAISRHIQEGLRDQPATPPEGAGTPPQH